MTTLSITDVSKVFQATGRRRAVTRALRKVSFDIHAGEVVTLIGESGSGKTTLGRIVLRLTAPTSGSVLFEGSNIADFERAGLRDYYRQVQGVFQDPFSSYNPIYKADRVFELIRAEYFREMPRPAWSAKIESALDAVALNPGDVLNKYPHQLSGGQQQRMLIARALLLEVKLLVADEIISMLDASTRVDVLNLLVRLKRAGLGILFITHDLSLGNYLSDRTVILRYGAVVEMGPTVKVFGNPLHSYTRMLLAAVPQLHKKWQPATDTQAAGNRADGAAARLGLASATDSDRPSGRRSRTAAHSDGAAAGRPRAAAGWSAATFGNRPRAVQDRLALAPLVEREPGHFAAEEED
jgi:ABC-type oligopeptide transport system ATPase subunit